jgi:prevent-host-death family protein
VVVIQSDAKNAKFGVFEILNDFSEYCLIDILVVKLLIIVLTHEQRRIMKFSSDEMMPFNEVRTGMSSLLVDVQAGKEVVITRHGKPIAALVGAAHLYRYRQLDRLMNELTALLQSKNEASDSMPLQASLIELVERVEPLFVHGEGKKP